MDRQERHEAIVKLLNPTSQYRNELKIREEELSTSEIPTTLTIEEINKGVVVFCDALNLASGSAFTMDLYRCLQSYMLDLDKRKEMNKIIDEGEEY